MIRVWVIVGSDNAYWQQGLMQSGLQLPIHHYGPLPDISTFQPGQMLLWNPIPLFTVTVMCVEMNLSND